MIRWKRGKGSILWEEEGGRRLPNTFPLSLFAISVAWTTPLLVLNLAGPFDVGPWPWLYLLGAMTVASCAPLAWGGWMVARRVALSMSSEDQSTVPLVYPFLTTLGFITLGLSIPLWRALFLTYVEGPLSAEAVVWVSCVPPQLMMVFVGMAAWPPVLPAESSTSEKVEAGSTDEGEEVPQAGTS